MKINIIAKVIKKLTRIKLFKYSFAFLQKITNKDYEFHFFKLNRKRVLKRFFESIEVTKSCKRTTKVLDVIISCYNPLLAPSFHSKRKIATIPWLITIIITHIKSLQTLMYFVSCVLQITLICSQLEYSNREHFLLLF